MTPERWKRLNELFEAALEQDSASRAGFVARAAADDPALAEEVLRVLASDEKADAFLSQPPPTPLLGATEGLGSNTALRERVQAAISSDKREESFIEPTLGSGDVTGPRPMPGPIGPYRPEREIGHGGMGAVYLASRSDHEYEKNVAIKVIRRGMETELAVARFRNERQILAGLQHPNIASLLDGGTTEDGLPYIVMEYVDGEAIDHYCDERHLSIAQRLELFLAVAGAVQHAHASLVIHRDIKPGNILVTKDGVPKLLDFGVAKLLDVAANDSEQTATNQRFFTPAYASPEQIRGEPITIGSDVYSLGVLLYVLLTGHRPYGSGTSSAEEVARAVLHDDPLKPSTAVRRRPPPENPEGTPERLRRRLAGDLDTIILKSMRKPPSQRYTSVEQLALDIRNHLEGRPVLARPGTLGYRASRFASRHRVGVSAVAVAVLAVLAAVAELARAGAQTLDAARLGALAESMEAQLRMEHLAPPHDLRPALARIRTTVESLPTAKGGPANFARGKGLELLGDLQGARAGFERAWAAGFRTPRVAESLGTVLARLYQREQQQMLGALEPEARQQRAAALRKELLEPALAYLAVGDTTGWRGPYLKAVATLAEGHPEVAQERAAEAYAADPERYEARLLAGESWVRVAQVRVRTDRLEDALTAFDRARDVLEEAEKWGRSDPAVAEALARAHDGKADALARLGKSPDQEAETASQWFHRASQLDPDSPTLLVALARSMATRANHLMHVGRSADSLPVMEEAEKNLQRAIEMEPSNKEAHRLMTYSFYFRASRLAAAGRPTLPVLQEGNRWVERASAGFPKDPDIKLWATGIRLEEAQALFREGKDPSAALAAALAHGEEALRYKIGVPGQVRTLMADALTLAAKESFRAGRDPRPALERAAAFTEESLRARAGDPGVANSALLMYRESAALQLAIAGDARPVLSRALRLVEELIRASPNRPLLRQHKGRILLAEADRRLEDGEDAIATIEEAEKSFRKSVELGLAEALRDNLPFVALRRARALAVRGVDPTAELARAQTLFEAIASAPSIGDGVPAFLASVALERAAWLRRQHRSASAEAQRGLSHLSRALEVDGRNSLLWLTRGRLEALAGEKEAALASLQRAWKANPLIKASGESKLAEAEIQR